MKDIFLPFLFVFALFGGVLDAICPICLHFYVFPGSFMGMRDILASSGYSAIFFSFLPVFGAFLTFFARFSFFIFWGVIHGNLGYFGILRFFYPLFFARFFVFFPFLGCYSGFLPGFLEVIYRNKGYFGTLLVFCRLFFALFIRFFPAFSEFLSIFFYFPLSRVLLRIFAQLFRIFSFLGVIYGNGGYFGFLAGFLPSFSPFFPFSPFLGCF